MKILSIEKSLLKKVLLLNAAVAVCSALSFVSFLVFIALLESHISLFLGFWQALTLLLVVTVAVWRIFESYADWRSIFAKIIGLVFLQIERARFECEGLLVWKSSLEYSAVQGDRRVWKRLAFPAGIVAAVFYTGFFALPDLWDMRYESFRYDLVEHGYTEPFPQLRGRPAGGRGIFEAAQAVNPDKIFSGKGNRRLALKGKWDAQSLSFAREAAKSHLAFIDGEMAPLIRNGVLYEFPDNTLHSFPGMEHSLKSVAAVAKIIACCSADAGAGNALPKAWNYVDLDLSLAELLARSRCMFGLALAFYAYENAVTAADGLLLAHPAETVPPALAARFGKFLSVGMTERFLNMEWAARVAVFEAQKNGVPSSRCSFPDCLLWVRNLRLDMELVLLGPFQLAISDESKNTAGNVYGSLASLSAALDRAADRKNMFFYNYRRPGDCSCWQELLLRSRLRLLLVCNALNGYRKIHGSLPLDLSALDKTALPADFWLSPVTGKKIQYKLLPGGGFSLLDVLPQSLLDAVSQPQPQLES